MRTRKWDRGGVRAVWSAFALTALGACALEAGDGSGAAEAPGEIREGIIGGQTATAGEFPWMVDIQAVAQPGGHAGGHWCGGALVDPQWVLTAAHCVADNVPSDFTLYVGGVRTSVTEANEQVRHALGTYTQTDSALGNVRSDVALIKLDTPITTIQPLRLATVDPAVGTSVTAIGWGRTSPNSETPDLLQSAALPVLANAVCFDAVLPFGIRPEGLCTGYADGHVSACYGDSGSPVLSRAADGGWQLAAVTSYGAVGCVGYSVDMRVAWFREWIEATMRSPQVETPTVTPGIVAFAGNGTSASTGDGGLATAAGLADPSDVAVTADGNVYVLEAATNNIRRINPATGIIDTVFQGKPNIVRNGEASQGALGATTPEWTQFGIWKTAMDAACAGCALDGDAYFTPNASSGYLEQEIDVSAAAAAIDARQIVYDLSGNVGGDSGSARAWVTCVGATGGTAVASFLLPRAVPPWNSFDVTLTPPIGTRKLRVRLFADPLAGSNVSGIRYDKLMLRELSSTGTLRRPSALAALGSKLYAVEFNTGTTYAITPGVATRQTLGPSSGNVAGIGVRSLAAFEDFTIGGAPPAFVWAQAGGAVSGSKFGSVMGYYYGSSFGSDSQGPARGVAVSMFNGGSHISVTTAGGNVLQKLYSVASPPALTSSVVAYWGAAPGLVNNPTGSYQPPRESFSLPSGIAPFPGTGLVPDFLIADAGNNVVRRISSGGAWNSRLFYAFTLAGNGTAGWSGDGQLASAAKLKAPSAVAMGPAGSGVAYVLDRGNARIRKLVCLTTNVCSSRVAFNPATQACLTTTVDPSVVLDDHNACTADSCDINAIRHSLGCAPGPGSSPAP